MEHDQPLTTHQQPAVDFDTRPPVPVNDYEQTVRRVNVGYDLLFTITHSFLRALSRPNLELLVVGAGGGAEIESFLPNNPDWRLTGVDPSADMLAVARTKAEHLRVHDRVRLLRGTVDDLPHDPRALTPPSACSCCTSCQMRASWRPCAASTVGCVRAHP
jgi:hypothetical protein